MPVITNPETRRQLQQIGCLLDNRVDGTALAKLLAQRLEADHIAASAADIDKVERTIGQLVTDLIGDPDEEVIEVAKALLSTNANGRVQKALSNGYLLCGRRMKLHVTIKGESRIVNVATRFLTAEPDLLKQYVFDARLVRVESYARSMKELSEVVEHRQPGMSTDVGDFLRQLNATWQKELPVPTPTINQPTPTTRRRNKQ